jgi:four helix bundle protein
MASDEIALKSGNETKYWLCILRDGFEIHDEEIKTLLKEGDELCKILAASIITLRRKIKMSINISK